MDAIVVLCRVQRLLPLARGLVESVQQVKALTALVQLFCLFLLEDRKHERNVNAFSLESPVVFGDCSTMLPEQRRHMGCVFVLGTLELDSGIT